MKRILNLALGIGALVATSMSATPEAKAVTWGSAIGQWNYTWWQDTTDVSADISTTASSSTYATYATYGNPHRGGYYVQCTGQQLWGWPPWGTVWANGSQTRWTHWCPNGSVVSTSYGWVDDNYYQ